MQQIPWLNLEHRGEKNARFVEMWNRAQAETFLCGDYPIKCTQSPVLSQQALTYMVAFFVGTVVLNCAQDL